MKLPVLYDPLGYSVILQCGGKFHKIKEKKKRTANKEKMVSVLNVIEKLRPS